MTSGSTGASSSMLLSILSIIVRVRSSWPSREPGAPCAAMRWKCTDTPSGANAIISGSTVGFPGGSRNPSRALQPIISMLRSYDAVLTQPFEFIGVNPAKRAQRCLSMLAEKRRAAHLGRGIRQLDRAADGFVCAACRVIDVEDHLARLQMRVGQYLAGVLAGATRHAGLAQ